MAQPIDVTVVVALHLPLDLLNSIREEAVRKDMSIDAMLSIQLCEAAEERRQFEFEDAAIRHVNGDLAVTAEQIPFGAADGEDVHPLRES